MTQLTVLLLALLPSMLRADAGDPVRIFGRWKDERPKTILLDIGLEVVEHGFRVYKDSLKVTFPKHEVVLNQMPAGEKRADPTSHGEKEVYVDKVTWPVELERDPHAGRDEQVEVKMTYRACNDLTCLWPKTKRIRLSAKHPQERK